MKTKKAANILMLSSIVSTIISIFVLFYGIYFVNKINSEIEEPKSIVFNEDPRLNGIVFELQVMQQKVDILWSESKNSSVKD